MEKRSVCIVGGGASGLTAAVMAARAGAQVTLLEHNEKPGRKLLATGNGKCNLTNVRQEPSCYRSASRDRAWEILREFSLSDTLRFFSEIGVYTKNKKGGLYPASMQASSVLELLEAEARYQKVKIKCQEHVKSIEKTHSGEFLVHTSTWSYPAQAVILACGSRASSIQGADGSGYELASSLGHTLRKPLPALVPLKGKGNYFSKWAGVRVEGRISLQADGEIFYTEEGELQLTEYGISGIPVFQISGPAVRLIEEGIPVTVLLDFIPDFDRKGLEVFLRKRKEQCPYKSQKELLVGLLPSRLIQVLAKKDQSLEELALAIKEFPVKITGPKSFEQAQVCQGGVRLEEIHPKTMESLLTPGIYLAGELLDVDGICGGYNLQWAWTTGALAGKSAACSRPGNSDPGRR